MVRQILPIEQVIGRKDRPDMLGTFLGWSIFAFGIWSVIEAYSMYHSHAFARAFWPIVAGVGLILAVCGWGLARRHLFALWLAGGLALYVLTMVPLGLLEGGTGYRLLPRAVAAVLITVSIFGYFLHLRHEFRETR